MAGAGETIVIDSAKPQLERAEATQIRAKMLQESIGSVGKNIMDMVTQYQDIKAQDQKGKLASITFAGTLSGGMDNLPQETKNKLPGILGVPLPTDEQGNVKITPDTETVIKRQTLQLMQNDPDAAKILMGLREKESDPHKLANDLERQKMQNASEAAKIAAENARTAVTNETNVHRTILESQAKLEAANIAATSRERSAGLRGAAAGKGDDLPSPYVLDPKTDTLMDEPQWYSTYPGEQIPTRLSNRDAKLISSHQRGVAATAASNSQVQANQARLKTANLKMDTMIANQGHTRAAGQMKILIDAYRLSKGTDGEQAMKDLVNRELPNIFKDEGFDDESIAALGTMSGDGGWADWALNKFNSAMGVTSTGGGASLLQPMVATIPGVSPQALDIGVRALRGGATTATPSTGGTAQAGTSTSGTAPAGTSTTTTYKGDAAKQYLGVK